LTDDSIESPCKVFISFYKYLRKGDLIKANMLAKQIALYRNVSDVNFQRSTMIDLQAQLLCSNHIVHRAQIENLKGINAINLFKSDDQEMIRDHKYSEMACYQADIETLLRDSMDEVYTSQEEHVVKPSQLEIEMSNIMRQALDPTCQYMNRTIIPGAQEEETVVIHLRVHHPNLFESIDDKKITKPLSKPDGATLSIPTLVYFIELIDF
jgi:predicted transposase YbfD/YdcC